MKVLIYVFVISALLLPWNGEAIAHEKVPLKIQKQLIEVYSLMETESWVEAKVLLNTLLSETENKFARSLIAQSLGQIEVRQDNLTKALHFFQLAYDLTGPKNKNRNQLLHTIGQLHCGVDEWVACREKLQKWIGYEPEKAKATDYITIAQAYSATEDWEGVVEPAKHAIEIIGNAPISWYQLSVVAYSYLSRWEDSILSQKMLLKNYPNEPKEWRRLVSFHLQMDDYSSALKSMRIPFEKGLLRDEKDYRQITQLLFHEGLPYQAGKAFSEGLREGVVDQTVQNYKLLANIWRHAKEFDLAIETFNKLIALEADSRWYKQLAQLYFKKKEWLSAINVIKKIAHRDKASDLQFMLGIAFINTRNFNDARAVLHSLKAEKTYEKRVSQWLTYIDKVDESSSNT